MKLKPCPFCGGEAELETKKYDGSAKFVSRVYCTDCGVIKSDLYGPPEKAIKLWNRRVRK